MWRVEQIAPRCVGLFATLFISDMIETDMSTLLPVQVNKGTGEPIVLIHGLGNTHKSWTYVLENLDYTQNTVISMDLLGFGDAEKPEDCDYTPSDHADAVISTLDELGVKDALIAGHSMGCIVAAEVARKRPDLVRKLVLLGDPLFKRMPRRYDRFRFWKKEDLYSRLFRLIGKQKDLTLTAAQGVNKFLPLIKGMEVNEDTWPAFRKSLRSTIMQTKSYQDLIELQIPTLLIYGALDLFVIKKNLVSVAKRNKNYVTFESALGPHEITPVHGKSIAELLQSQ